MSNPKFTLLLLASLGFSTVIYANNNPATKLEVEELISAKIRELNIPSAVTVGEQTQGGIAIWVDGSGRSGTVAALENDVAFTGDVTLLPYNDTGTDPNDDNFNSRTSAYASAPMGSGYINTTSALYRGGYNDTREFTPPTGPDFGAGLAVQYMTNMAGEVGSENCTEGVPSGPSSCLGGWYIPNVGEFEVMFHALCGTTYALPTGTKYWTSTMQQDGNIPELKAGYFAATLPADCETGSISYTRTSSNLPASDGYAIRYIRQFG